MNPVLRENLEVFFGEGHVLTVYFYLLIVLAPVEFVALYTQSLGEQMWRGSGLLLESLRVCRPGADRLFRAAGGEPGICAGALQAARAMAARAAAMRSASSREAGWRFSLVHVVLSARS